MNKSEKSLIFFNHTHTYLKSNPIIFLRKKIITDLLGVVTNKKIIDIGCGNGEVTKGFLSYNKVTFLDLSPNMLALVKENIIFDYLPNASFVNTDIAFFKPDNKFDFVVCVGVIAHVDNISGLLNKLIEIASDNGIIILQYTASEKLISKFNQIRKGLFSKTKYDYNYKVNITSSFYIKKLLKQAGLNIIKEVKYLPVSPLFSVFSYETKIKALKFSYRNKLFSFLGSEIILYLSKNSIAE